MLFVEVLPRLHSLVGCALAVEMTGKISINIIFGHRGAPTFILRGLMY